MSATGYEETELTYNVNEEVIVKKKLMEGETLVKTAVAWIHHFLCPLFSFESRRLIILILILIKPA